MRGDDPELTGSRPVDARLSILLEMDWHRSLQSMADAAIDAALLRMHSSSLLTKAALV